MRVVSGLAIASLFVFVSQAVAESQPGWLIYLNLYRSQAGVPPVTEDRALARGDALHAEYSVKNWLLSRLPLAHSEDPTRPGYTPEGNQAAAWSNGAIAKTDEEAFAQWMQAPFHAAGLLDSRLKKAGYGTYSSQGVTSQWLNVASAMGDVPAGQRFPILWPPDRGTTPILSHWGEIPEPIESCPGYTLPSGLPLIILLKPWTTVDITDSSFENVSPAQRPVALQHCVLTSKNFRYPDKAWQDTERKTMESRGLVTLIPREPLQKGQIYRASVSVVTDKNVRETITWQFATSR